MAKAKVGTEEVQPELPLWEGMDYKNLVSRIGRLHMDALDKIKIDTGMASRRRVIEALIRKAVKDGGVL